MLSGLEIFLGKETENNWESRESLLKKIIDLINDNEITPSGLSQSIKPFYDDILSTVLTRSFSLQ